MFCGFRRLRSRYRSGWWRVWREGKLYHGLGSGLRSLGLFTRERSHVRQMLRGIGRAYRLRGTEGLRRRSRLNQDWLVLRLTLDNR